VSLLLRFKFVNVFSIVCLTQFHYPKLYDGKLVRVRAELHRDNEPFLYDSSCRSPNVNTRSPIYLDGLEKVNVTVSQRLTTQPYQPYVVIDGEMVAVGVFKADYFQPNGAPLVPHFRIILESAALFRE
jgi:hypothetical protein